MLQTVRQAISDVRNSLNSINLDDWISARYIHSKLIDTTSLFLKREADERRLFLYPDIWTTIESFKLEEKPLITCSSISVPECDTVMRSIHKLPKLFSNRYGYFIQINSIDFDKNYTQTTPEMYKRDMGRRYRDPGKRYFWLYNDYLVIPNATVESVTVRGIFVNKAHALKTDDCDDCGNTCISMLDQEFPAPIHMMNDIKDFTVKSIAGTKKSIQADQYANLNSDEKDSKVSKG